MKRKRKRKRWNKVASLTNEWNHEPWGLHRDKNDTRNKQELEITPVKREARNTNEWKPKEWDDRSKRATSQCLRNKWMEAPYLEPIEWGKKTTCYTTKISLRRSLERSCWKINNERISLLWAYGKHLKIMRWQPATDGKELIGWDQQRDKNFFHREDKEKNLDYW